MPPVGVSASRRDMTRLYFRDLCPQTFSFLVDTFGFDPPRIAQAGAEVSVTYEKDLYTVKVVMEAGLAPQIELHYPASDPADRPVPYLLRDGIPRAGRIRGLRSGVDDQPDWPEEEEGYLRALAQDLLTAEGPRFDTWIRR